MSTKTPVIEEQATSTSVEAEPLPRQGILQKIVSMVRRDCQVDAQAYLDEAKVPHGGE